VSIPTEKFPLDCVGGRIVDFKEQGVRFWTRFNWLRIWYLGGHGK
jgi:hypothetical protein